MLKKFLVFMIVLTLLIGATLTPSSASETSGSIDFEAGNTTVITPEGPCCKCYENTPCDGSCSDPKCDGCDCLCHDPGEGNYNNFWLTREITDDLYFGTNTLISGSDYKQVLVEKLSILARQLPEDKLDFAVDMLKALQKLN